MDELQAGGQTFTTDVALRWGDMDSLGHVNNAAIVTLLEESRVRFLSDLASRGIESGSFGLVAARHEIDYRRPLYYSTTPLRAVTWIARVGRSSFTVSAELTDPAGDVAVRASTVVVATSLDGPGSAPLPESARQVLARYLPR